MKVLRTAGLLTARNLPVRIGCDTTCFSDAAQFADQSLVTLKAHPLAGSGIAFNERGIYELKGIPGEWRLFAVKRGA